MIRDHYIPQVYLRKFCPPALGGERLRAVDKRTLRQFTVHTKKVCCIGGGSTNPQLVRVPFFEDPRAVERTLSFIENGYNCATKRVRENKMDRESVAVIAKFVAYLMTSTPAVVRISPKVRQEGTEEAVSALKHDPKYGCKEFVITYEGAEDDEVVKVLDDVIKINVMPKFYQAISLARLDPAAWNFGNGHWFIIINNTDSPFFTSDFPVAMIKGTGAITPLAPDIAVCIESAPLHERPKTLEWSFSKFSCEYLNASKQQVRQINQRIVKYAENTVFFRDELPWVYRFIEKNAGYRMEAGYDLAKYPVAA